MKHPLISVIVPIYNIETYIAEAIESVIVQNIGFRDNIEIILVDDGSIDKSSEICQRYAAKYPDNVRYIRQDNSGVSAARNTGYALAKGTYIHFFDGDDIISKDFYRMAIKFLEDNDVNFVAAKLKFFDEIIDSHPLNYKFHHERVVDLSLEPDNPILHVISCVFRRESLKDVSFDKQLRIAEDVVFISDVLLREKRYGVMTKPTYYYRKRTGSESAISGKERDRGYYLDTPKLAYERMLSMWQKSGDARPIEYTLLYDLSYRLDQKKQTVLNRKEQEEYVATIKNLLASCSDEVILRHRFLSVHKKRYALQSKYGKGFTKYLETRDGVTYFKDHPLYRHDETSFHIDFLTRLDNDTYQVEGYVGGPLNLPGVSHGIDVSGKTYPIKQYMLREQRKQSFMGETYYEGGAFKAKVKLTAGATLSGVVQTPERISSARLETGQFTRFGALKLTYRRDDNLLLKRMSRVINTYEYSLSKHILLELRLWFQILLNWRLRTARDQLRKLMSRNLKQLGFKAKVFEVLKPIFIVGESVVMIPRALVLRTGYYIAKSRKTRQLWLITDRGMAAGDNAEALFRYVMAQKDCPADVYFVISAQSKDFDRMRQIGPVLNQGSFAHKLKVLLADKIISSQADIETTNPFIRQVNHYVDLFNFDFVFLQHGIIRHNLSSWLNRYDKNIRLFVTSAKKEYDSIFSNPYYYDKENVLLSGLPRFDYLQNKPNHKLILAPTYRKNLAKEKTDRNGARRYDTTFKNSEYRKFYNNFMNDRRLREALRKAGMKGEFYLHPAFSSQRQDFDENNEFSVMKFPYDYKTAFSEGEMLVSDHSSVVFDFAYLKKPVAYAHFDVDTFFEGHSYAKSNFFFDEKDGFGEVYYDYDTLINGVVKVIESGCAMSDKYKARVDNFFYKVDKNNCKRVYDVIIEIDK